MSIASRIERLEEKATDTATWHGPPVIIEARDFDTEAELESHLAGLGERTVIIVHMPDEPLQP